MTRPLWHHLDQALAPQTAWPLLKSWGGSDKANSKAFGSHTLCSWTASHFLRGKSQWLVSVSITSHCIYGTFQGKLKPEVEPDNMGVSFGVSILWLWHFEPYFPPMKNENLIYINHKERWKGENEIMHLQMLLWDIQVLWIFIVVLLLLFLLLLLLLFPNSTLS